MGTKQHRVSDIGEIKKSIRSFLGKKINVVFTDSNVVFGVLKEVNETELVITNMRLKNTRFPLDSISEFYVDTNV
jgi:ferredoxin-fold anticodon binding domain-containing protein